MVLVGISRANPHLHAFTTAENPHTPLVLGSWEWEALHKGNGRTTVIDWNCDDHGSNFEWQVELATDSAGLHAKALKILLPRLGIAENAPRNRRALARLALLHGPFSANGIILDPVTNAAELMLRATARRATSANGSRPRRVALNTSPPNLMGANATKRSNSSRSCGMRASRLNGL